MGDEFPETDLDTPTAAELDAAYGSRFLGVVDVTKNIRTKIARVGMEDIKDRDSGKMKKRAIIFFENIDKPLVLNASNKEILIEKLGKAPAGWKGAVVGIFVDPSVMFGGVRKGGVRLRVLPAKAAQPAAAPAMAPKPATAAAEWSEDEGDPGFDPDLVPDFDKAS